jgi:hypothetical protein
MLHALFGEADKEETAAVKHYEVYRLGADFLGSRAEKALAVGAFIVDKDENIAGADFRQNFFDRGNGHKYNENRPTPETL